VTCRPLVAEQPLAFQLLLPVVLPVTPVNALDELFHVQWIQPQGLAGIAQGTAGAVADHGGRQGRPVPSVLAVDILDDFLAPFVFKIHVDIRGSPRSFEMNRSSSRLMRRGSTSVIPRQ